MYFRDPQAVTFLDMDAQANPIYTIGHSNHAWERFQELIRPHGIEVLVDVRSYPRSRFAPWSNREKLEAELPKIDIEYRWMGDALGGYPRGPRKSRTNPVKSIDDWYEERAKSMDFKDGIESVSRLAKEKRIVVMCSEGDPANCHRSLLLTPAFQRVDIEVLHILPKEPGVALPAMRIEA